MSNPISTILSVIILALIVQAGYQSFRLLDDRDRLNARIQAQQPTVRDVEKVRQQLLSLAGQTALLAEEGNQNAIRLIAALREQGVVIRPPERNAR